MRLTTIIFTLLITLLLSCKAANNEKYNYVPDEKTAIEVGKSVLLPFFGDDLKDFLPLKATLLQDKIWRVEPVNALEFGGVVPIVEIRRTDSKIVKLVYKPI